MRTRRWIGVLRQVWWASIPVWSLGFLAFLPFLRIALGRRTRRDWAVFAGYVAAVVLESVLVGVTGNAIGGAVVLAVMGTAAVHASFAFRPSAGPLLSGPVPAVPLPAGPLPAGPLSAEPAAPRHARPDNKRAVEQARDRMARRVDALRLAQDKPALARELRIGRPDLARDYDDGGLVDVNHVPGSALATFLGFTATEAAAVLAARDRLGRFSSADELCVYAELPPGRIDEVRDRMFFG
jgi:hypothetical protein